MKKGFMFSTSLLATALFAVNTYAVQFGPTIKDSVVITHGGRTLGSTPQKKEVVLMNIKLSSQQRSSLFQYTPKRSSYRAAMELPTNVDLGMNGVPVLDQGYHGSCVAFALTAAVDAVLGKGDYVSQLCHLELGNYLENTSYLPSGWNGTIGSWMLDQIVRYGVVSKEKQKQLSCAHVSEYPLKDWDYEGNAMNPNEFKNMSEDVSNKLYAVTHMNLFERWENKFSDADAADKALVKIKESLARGNRVAFATFLVLSPYCSAGACATHNAVQDTWALTDEISTPPYGIGGHEMVIVGYDDNATALDEKGNTHQGLLKLRNSWGAEVGDQGNYYMTYDYFKKFATEVIEIVGTKNG